MILGSIKILVSFLPSLSFLLPSFFLFLLETVSMYFLIIYDPVYIQKGHKVTCYTESGETHGEIHCRRQGEEQLQRRRGRRTSGTEARVSVRALPWTQPPLGPSGSSQSRILVLKPEEYHCLRTQTNIAVQREHD